MKLRAFCPRLLIAVVLAVAGGWLHAQPADGQQRPMEVADTARLVGPVQPRISPSGNHVALVVVDGNPLEDLSALENVEVVVKGGEVVVTDE